VKQNRNKNIAKTQENNSPFPPLNLRGGWGALLNSKKGILGSMTACVFIFAMIILFPIIAGAATDDYVIGDGDTLQISVWGSPELSTGAIVRPDGKITLPAVGDVVASGFTPEDLSKKLAEKLESVVKKAIVTVTVTGITNNKVYVFGGGVEKTIQGATYSGVYFLPGRTSLLKFLCRLGNLGNADLKRTYIMRDGKKVDVDIYSLFVKGDMSKDTFLKAEDIIYMPDNELNKMYVMGAVNQPRYLFYREGIRILDAILEAGGFTKFAKENDVLVLRNTSKDGKQMQTINVKVKDFMKEGDVSQNINLMPGDLVVVKESIF
jgi:polysaccharide biosynthesis/export protein